MSEQEKEIARLCFTGPRYDGHALDSVALEELVQFQKVLTDMAKAVWKAKHPDRDRLPNEFDEHTRFVFRTIEDGSAVVPLELRPEPQKSKQLPMWPHSVEVAEAVELVYSVFDAANSDKPLPEDVPKQALSSLAALGRKLPSDGEMHFAPKGREMTPISRSARERLTAITERAYSDELEITGRVLEADVRQQRFQIWMNDGTSTRVKFSELQEAEVTTALKEHASVQLVVKGKGEFNSDGVLQQIQNAESLRVVLDDNSDLDPSAPRIEDVISNIFSEVSDQEWERLPSDLSHRHDFYLYGDGKR